MPDYNGRSHEAQEMKFQKYLLRDEVICLILASKLQLLSAAQFLHWNPKAQLRPPDTAELCKKIFAVI